MRILLRVVINMVALWLASNALSGITLSDEPLRVALVAVIFGIVNALVRPIVKFLTFPITLVTLGLFILVVNAAMLQITDWVSEDLNVEGFWTSVAGGLIISIVSWLLSVFVPDGDKNEKEQA